MTLLSNDASGELLSLIWLTETAALSSRKACLLLQTFGSAKTVWNTPVSDLAQRCTLSAGERKRLEQRSLAKAERILSVCRAKSIAILSVLDRNYPPQLRQIGDPPAILYVRGKLPDPEQYPAIAVVGQRMATVYGTTTAQSLAYRLSSSGFVVISGMATGIDSAGHLGALQGGTPTVAVLGTAIDRCYPAENYALMQEILAHGAVVSEYPPGASTLPAYFPRRNRIISGLSRGVVVVEAGAHSGALITAELAADQGRDVFAVPGPITAPSSEGCNHLIASGAKIVCSAEDILEEYPAFSVPEMPGAPKVPAAQPSFPQKPPAAAAAFSQPAANKPVPQPAPPQKEPAPSTPEEIILRALDGIMTLGDLSVRTGIPPERLAPRLILLEISGKVRILPGQKYELIR